MLTMHLELSPARYRDYGRRVEFVHTVLQKVKSLPGVVSAGITTNIPLTLNSRDSALTVEGHPVANPASVPFTSHRLVTPDYLRTLGVMLVKGRLLTEQDRAGTVPVVVVSEELARQAWPGEDPIGKHIRRGTQEDAGFPWLTVVGVVKNVEEDYSNFRIDRPVWYLPYYQQQNAFPLDLAVRSTLDPANLTAAVRQAVYSADAQQAISDITTIGAHVAGVVSTDRFSAILMGALAALGLTLSMIGLYGVMAYTITRQTREIGVRVASGASLREILKMTISPGARLTGAGLVLGVLGALTVSSLLSNGLYGVNPRDPVIFGVVSLSLIAVALAACYIPARRATKLDPMVALRYK